MTGDPERPAHALVAFASRHGATVELAGPLAERIRDASPAGAEVVVRRCAEVDGVRDFDGVVLGSPVHLGHRRAEAHDLVLRCALGLWERPVWLFSRGPLGVPGRPPEVLIGDFRPWDEVRTWGADIGRALPVEVADGPAASA